jgi:hypothetical protein
MKAEEIYERRQSAGRMEVILIVTSVVGMIAAILALFNYGWFPGLTLFFLSVIAYGLSRVFDLLSDLLGSVEEKRAPKKDESAASQALSPKGQ